MYLKSIEVQGFKSFANKIVFEFHNGITGIVGPNGSGKSNVADAVRWVLGEQSAKQLRGASMQDVIFAGTENRKPLSYAYVAITMDNSDHQLAIDYEEVTVSRRVYRSGESEYLINGSPCRLKDVTELFYDTGIGKEGYSIIGQGQIEKILSGKPEERRELFDEAAGIVKYKKRKAAAQKKLENERENLVRVNDILAELERQVGPLERQAEKARIYLKKKEELKTLDANMFLLEMEHIEEQQKEVQEKYQIADRQYQEAKHSYEQIKAEYEKLEQDIASEEEQIQMIRENMNEAVLNKSRLEGQIELLKEQIHSAKQSDEHMQSRLEMIGREKQERVASRSDYEKEREQLDKQLSEIAGQKAEAEKKLSEMQEAIRMANEQIEQGKQEIIDILNQKASVKARQQRFDAMEEQINIRKAQLTKRLLERRTQEADLDAVWQEHKQKLDEVNKKIADYRKTGQELELKSREWKKKSTETSQKLEELMTRYHKEQSRLESLKNIAERYDGYGNSIRKVMEQKSDHKGLIGVVSDLIQVDKKYEIAIETALGGNIQNIVTEDEKTAKEMIAFLKKNRFGRATFLPLTSVDGTGNFKNKDALEEPGVLGLANQLVKTEPKYEGITAYLLGRVIVTEQIDDAIRLAGKYRYTLHIVTLEGEYLSPGGSMTGGAFRNSSNLLARKREIEELEASVLTAKHQIEEKKKRLEEIKIAQSLLFDDIEEKRTAMQEQFILQNTAQMNVDRISQQKNESENAYANLKTENTQIETQLSEIAQNKAKIEEELLQANEREQQIAQANEKHQELLDAARKDEENVSGITSELSLTYAGIRQKSEFVLENISRIEQEIKRYEQEQEQVLSEAGEAKGDAEKKAQEIETIQAMLTSYGAKRAEQEESLKVHTEQKEQLSASYKGYFQKQEETSKTITDLDKEIFRLNSQREKLEEAAENQTSYMWDEYEMTLHAALEWKQEDASLPEIKKKVSETKDEIRRLGDVNVNAIEDYKEVSERYTFLKGQHDDLIEAEKTLVGIIEELDTGMRRQFMEKFAQIQQEFDKVFKELFGGGKGTLELVEGEDILECGIRIIAQPPGKKLQNMMQMSGGEKSLTAISLLFAIQNLKPSPFCLLDEIEAALDDSNVGRFAKYLHKLTENTQFIVITHRRGTMAAADRLYGITMQEKGISTLVSVNLIDEELDK